MRTTQTSSERYRRWFDYERDSHAKVLASLNAVPNERRSSPSFQKAIDLMAHIVAARWLWLFRLGLAKQAPEEVFPQGVPLAELPVKAAEMERAWSAFLDRVDDAEPARKFEYQSLEGPWFRNSIEDILAQLFGHSWYHRGQIAALVRSIGAEPAATDFVLWSREPIPAPVREGQS